MSSIHIITPLFVFFLRKLFDIADRISHDSSPAINIYKNFITHGCNILDHGVEVRLKTSKSALMIPRGGGGDSA